MAAEPNPARRLKVVGRCHQALRLPNPAFEWPPPPSDRFTRSDGERLRRTLGNVAALVNRELAAEPPLKLSPCGGAGIEPAWPG